MDFTEELHFQFIVLTKRDKIIGVLAGLFAVIVTGCARGAVFAQYDPRILLAGFTIQGKSAPVACSTGLALAHVSCIWILLFYSCDSGCGRSEKSGEKPQKYRTGYGCDLSPDL